MTTLVFLCLPAFVLIVAGGIVLVFVVSYASKPSDEQRIKMERELQKLRVDRLRAERYQRDLLVVENRAHFVASQEALLALRIEKARRELGAPHDPEIGGKFTPNP